MNEHATKISGRIIYSNSGYISYKYNEDIYFKVAKLTYELFDNEEFQYIFEPYYDVLSAFPHLDIPGIDLSLKLSVYYRANITPVFVSERIIPRNRVNLQEVLKELGMDYYQPFLLLLDSPRVYGGDRLSLKSDAFYQRQTTISRESTDLYKIIPATLKKLGARSDLTIGDTQVNEQNRGILLTNYLFLYEKISKYYNEKSVGNKARKRQKVSLPLLEELRSLQIRGIITIEEAIKRSGAGSKSTYYRRLRELETKQE